jgi:hypothetical protein
MSTRSLLLLVAWIGGAELCARGYLAANAPAFHGGAWLLATALWVTTRRRHGFVRHAARTLALGFVLLSLTEAWPRGAHAPPEPSASFEASHGDPLALARWWQVHERERAILTGETELTPGQRFSWFDGEVELDDAGLRRAPPPHRGAFRIVVVGGSAAFDTPFSAPERSWPEQLEAAIAEDYTCARPVAVRNAGRPGATLEQLAYRFDSEITPESPDLMLVYAGLDALEGLLPAADAVPPATLPPRASRVLGALESILRERRAAARMQAALAEPPLAPRLQQSLAMRGYRRLILAARAKGIDVAVVTPVLALNGDSPEAAIRFHEAVWPEARRLVVARRAHQSLLPLVGASTRAAGLDASEGLDGDLDSFLDLIHLTPKGRARLAHNLSRALGPLLARSDAACEAR